MSFISSPTYQLSKHLVSILSPLVGNSPSHVTNSHEFSTFVRDQVLEDGMTLVSFDVISLFTKVPINRAKEVAYNRLLGDQSLPERTMLSADEVITLLDLCLKATYLCYRGNFYQQTFGTAMGSPVSVTVANLVMEDVEERALSTCESPPLFWKRYVDDVCAALPQANVGSFTEHLNSIEPTIQFTVELETDHKLPFLDMQVTHHPDGTLTTDVYRKKTHTERYLAFNYHHPLSQRVSVVWSLLSRAERICSTQSERDEEVRHVTTTLKNNGYPAHIIRRHGQVRRRDENREEPKVTVVLPYVRHVAESIRRILSPLGIRTCFKPHRTLKNYLVRPKDPVPSDLLKGVVYTIPCLDCSQRYVGQTGRTLQHRVREHKQAYAAANSINSAVAEHSIQECHRINWEGAEVLATKPGLYQRGYVESWHIRENTSSMNRDKGMLPDIYNSLIL